jgi:uncharacterized membrane protein
MLRKSACQEMKPEFRTPAQQGGIFLSHDKKGYTMKGATEEPEYHISKNRLETLVDGIFAFAMTLLVLGINLPKPTESLAPAALTGLIEGLVPQVFTFIIAFLVLALFWLAHHRQFHFVRQVDPTLLWINVFILIAIVFVPFSTDIAGDYPDVLSAVLLLHINMLIVGLFFAVEWRHICRHEDLCDPVPEKENVRRWFLRSALVPVVAVIAVIIAIFSPPLSLMTYLLLPAVAYLMRFIRSQ